MNPIAAATHLAPHDQDVRAQWEAAQTIPLLVTLLIAGTCAVVSQLVPENGMAAPLCVGGFALCTFAIARRFRS